MAEMTIVDISIALITFNESPKVLHFHEEENDKQQEVAIFILNFHLKT